VIELINLVKKFGDLVAVNDVTLTVPRGEFFAMLGPNAAGKTTTLKILAGLMKPTSGCARVCGFDVQLQPLESAAAHCLRAGFSVSLRQVDSRGNFSASPASCSRWMTQDRGQRAGIDRAFSSG
jgi:ABC-type branched-subunit amino acid transport system ATPase component